MRCDEVKYYIKDFAQGYLIDEMRKQIGDHLESCASCRKELEIIISENAAVKRHKHESQYNRYDPARYMMNNDSDSGDGKNKLNSEVRESRAHLSGSADDINNQAEEPSSQRSKWIVLFGMILVLLVTSLLVVMYFYRQPGLYWTAENIEGKPDIGGKALNEFGRLNKGEWLITDNSSRALLKVGAIGQIDVNSNSKIKLLDANPADNRIFMKEGSIETTVWSNPGVFFIQTSAGTVTDRGGIFSLTVNKKGGDVLYVSSGKAAIEFKGETSVIPSGAACESDPSAGPGIPYFEDSSPGFINAVRKYNTEREDTAAENGIINLSSKRDVLSLWYLLRTSNRTERGIIFDRIDKLLPLSSGITRTGVVAGRKSMMKELLNDIGYGSY